MPEGYFPKLPEDRAGLYLLSSPLPPCTALPVLSLSVCPVLACPPPLPVPAPVTQTDPEARRPLLSSPLKTRPSPSILFLPPTSIPIPIFHPPLLTHPHTPRLQFAIPLFGVTSQASKPPAGCCPTATCNNPSKSKLHHHHHRRGQVTSALLSSLASSNCPVEVQSGL
jgi:hypothetical protein